MQTIEQVVDVVVEHLGTLAKSGVVAGQPIEVGGLTVVVLSMVTVGLGAGGGEAEESARDAKAAPGGGTGEGVGGAARVRPAAVVAFTPQGVQVLSIPDQPDMVDKVFDRVPQVMELVEKAQRTFGGSA